MADSRKRSRRRRRRRRRRPAPSHPKKRDVVSDPEGKPGRRNAYRASKGRRAEKRGRRATQDSCHRLPNGPGPRRRRAYLACRSGHGWGRSSSRVTPSTWATAMMVFNVGLAGVSLPILPPFHSLVLVSRQACVIGHALLGEAALDAEALEVDAQLLGVPRPFLRIVFNGHAPKICGVRISLGHKVVAFAIL